MSHMAAIPLMDPAPEPCRWPDITAGRTVMGYLITDVRTEFFSPHPTRPELSQKPRLSVIIEAPSIDKHISERIYQAMCLIAEGFEVVLTVKENPQWRVDAYSLM